MRALVLFLTAATAFAAESGGFGLRDTLEKCKKVAYLTPSARQTVFEGEKAFDAEPMQPGPAKEISLVFFDGKLAKIVMTYKPSYSDKDHWKAMIASRKDKHDSMAPCDTEGNECYEWSDDDSAEKLVYYPDKPAITTMLIDRGSYKRAVYLKKKS